MAIDQDTRSCTIVLHGNTVSKEDVLCGTNILASGTVGYVSAPGAKTFCIHAGTPAANPDDVSIHVSVAGRFGFNNQTKGAVKVFESVEAATASHVELLFRDQHLSRADMWQIRSRIDSSVLYKDQKVKYLESTVASVEAIYVAGNEVDSAFVQHPQSKLIFRSGSARYTILIQISTEMLESWDSGNLMFERLISGFLPEMFQRWDKLKVRHQVSVIVFGHRQASIRWWDAENDESRGAGLDVESDDFFHVVACDMPSSSWNELIRKLKVVFNEMDVPRQVCLARQGNMLEAIHLAAIDFARENVDQHLTSTGTSIIAITAGEGLFRADYELLKRTTNLLLGNSVGVDIVSLAPKPLHPVPLFQYEREGNMEFALPHWLDISYWRSNNNTYTQKWLLDGSLGDVEDCAIPLVRKPIDSLGTHSSRAALEDFDQEVFSKVTTAADSMKSLHSTSPSKAQSSGDTKVRSLPQSREEQAPVPTHTPKVPINEEQELSVLPSQASTPLVERRKREGLPPHPLMQIGRKISLGPKGLAPSQGVASTTVSVQHAQHEKETGPSSPTTTAEASSGLAKQIRDSLRHKPSQQNVAVHPDPESTSLSKPIDIQSREDKKSEASRDPASLVEKGMMEQSGQSTQDSSLSATPKARSSSIPLTVSNSTEDWNGIICPWLTLLNPCNPRRDNMRVASEYRKWQNVFPQALSSAAFKWDSICTPASLPLMTEARVSMTDLEKHFNKKVRRVITAGPGTATSDAAHQVMSQMVAMRLTAGFQVVPMRNVQHSSVDFEQINRMLLSLGSNYHELRCLSNAEVQVAEFERQLEAESPANGGLDATIDYCAKIRPSLSRREQSSKITLDLLQSPTNWSSLDDQSVHPTALTDSLGSNQMRFVLIPIDPPRAEGKLGVVELADEERRLDGIQRLTQMWQRNRYFTDDDQRHRASMIKPKASSTVDRDPNPLAIEYQTRDPSAVVTAYGTTLAGQLENGEASAKLFAEADQYHSSNFDMTKLVKHLQEPPPSGVELRDRRWFTRLHFKCFRGDEMTNWLLRVFKDLQTREDAVALGNQLMESEIFTHVRGKHEFRDGNYFYQIKAVHRTTDYPDAAGLFSKAVGRSVPSTPISELKHSPYMRASQGDSDSSGKGTPTPGTAPVERREKKELLLAQMIQYNVDSSKKSNQLEIINLHFDRIHNPENCYHIQIDWTNTTPKLIRESVMRWTSLVESYGLKLIQLPLKEASKIHELHPFDRTISVRLAVRPPSQTLATPQLDPQSFSPRQMEDPDGYHKVIFRRMNFVLDLESASSFPRNLDVKYSWGRPEYQYTQFVHKSGLLLGQISNDGKSDFLLLPNRLAPPQSTGSGKRADIVSVNNLVRDFASFCRNEKVLNSLYEEVNKPKMAVPSPFATTALAADNDVPPMELPPHLTHRAALRNVS